MMSHPCISLAKVQFASITGSAGNITVVAAGGAGKKIRVLAFYLRQAAAGTIAWQDGAGGTALTGTMVTTTADLVVEGNFSPVGHFETSANTLLNISAGTGAVQGWAVYQIIG